MKYSVRTLLMAMVTAGASPISGFTQSGNQPQSSVEAEPRTQEIAAEQSLEFVLGDATGIVYLTSEPDGLRLVVTIARDGDVGGTPVRFVTTLAPDQMATVSMPGKFGEKSIEVGFLRQGERVVVKSLSRAGY
jgi:hypothetical protein